MTFPNDIELPSREIQDESSKIKRKTRKDF